MSKTRADLLMEVGDRLKDILVEESNKNSLAIVEVVGILETVKLAVFKASIEGN